jgi:hypothetical protein
LVWGEEKPHPLGNNVILANLGETFRVDSEISNPLGITTSEYQSDHMVSGTTMLTSDQAGENHWLFGNVVGAGVIDIGSPAYEFGYDLREPIFQPLSTGDILTHYAFAIEESVGLNTFNLDLATSNTSILKLNPSSEILLFVVPVQNVSGFYDGLVGASGTNTYIPEQAFSLF